MRRKRNAREPKCWTCKRSGHVAPQFPSRLSVVKSRQDENAGAHDNAITGTERIETIRPDTSEKVGLEYVLGKLTDMFKTENCQDMLSIEIPTVVT